MEHKAKALRVKLGKEKLRNFGYTISDHKGNVEKKFMHPKSSGGATRFDRSHKVLQGEARKYGDKVVFLKGHKKSGRVSDKDIPS